jgi:hypothetical protein
MLMLIVLPISTVSEELIVMELLIKLSQIGSGDAAQITFAAIPAGFVTIYGNIRIREVPM